MGWLSRMFGRDRTSDAVQPAETRANQQEWLDAFLHAQEFGMLHTSMGSLDEEQVTGSYSGFVKHNGPVWSLMLARMQLFSQTRFQWTRFRGGEVSSLFGSPELRIFERPWPGGTTADLLARMEMDVTVAGNSYIRRLRRGRGEDRLVRLRPDWVHILLGSRTNPDWPADAADVELLGYAYLPPRNSGDEALILSPDEVAHYAPYPDPDSTYIGMSWLTPVIRDVLGDNLQTDHKRQFMKNAATPNMVLKFDRSQTMEQVKQFKELFEAEHAGSYNAYKTLFLGGGADAEAIGTDFQQLDFAVTQGKAESRLASAAGVPPSWVGFSEGLQGSALNAGNFTAARRRLSDGTLQHLWSNAASSLQVLTDRPDDDGAALWFVTRGIPFLLMDETDAAAVQNRQAQTIVSLVEEGFEPESVTQAVINEDWTMLEHTGLTSVQLHPPGTSPGEGDS